MAAGGFCKIPRSILDDLDPVGWQVLTYLVLRAAWRPEKREVPGGRGRYVDLSRGEVLVGRRSLALELGRGAEATRGALARLKKEGVIAHQKSPQCPTHLGSVYLIVNFDSYNGDKKDAVHLSTHCQPTGNPPKPEKCCASKASSAGRISEVGKEKKTESQGNREGGRQKGEEEEKRLEELGLNFLLGPKPEMSHETKAMLEKRRGLRHAEDDPIKLASHMAKIKAQISMIRAGGLQ